MATHSFVFKLKHALPSGKEEHRRYGFSGDLRHPAVFTGLHDRVSSVFGLDEEQFYLATSDHLGRQVRLQDHAAFLRLVCEPTLSEQRQKSIKLDDKKRIVLIFHVVEEQKDETEAEADAETSAGPSSDYHAASTKSEAAATRDEHTAEALAQSREALGAGQKSKLKPKRSQVAHLIATAAASDSAPLIDAVAPLEPTAPLTTEGTGPPAPPSVPLSSFQPCHPPHPQHHHHNAATPGTSGPGALGGPFHHHHLPPHAHAHALGHSHAHSGHHARGQEGLAADRLSVIAKRIEMRRSMQEGLQQQGRVPAPAAAAPVASTSHAQQPEVVAPSADGYHPTYSTASSSVGQQVQAEEQRSKTPTQESPLGETWSGVKGLLKTFVKDLNRHLADNFGDEAAGFELSIPTEEETKKEEVKKVEPEIFAEAREEQVMHPAVFCDSCLKTIFGIRHKCTGCSNYDLCSRCLPKRDTFHNSQHVFARIARPGAMPVVDSPPAEEKQEKMAEPAQARPQILPQQLHPATCDVCNTNVRGVRHKCLECPDYDMCSNCHDNVGSVVHPFHNFFPIPTPASVLLRPQPGANTVHKHIICDTCDATPIIGVRYRCVEPECGDQFDMCARCEADPVPRHPRSHQLLKIREPTNGGHAATKLRMERARQIGAPSGGEAVPLAGLGSGIDRILRNLGVGAPETAEKGTSTEQQGLPSWATVVDGPGGDRTVVIDVDLNAPSSKVGQAPYDVDQLVREAEKEGEAEEVEVEQQQQPPVEEEEVAEPEIPEETVDTSLKSRFVADVTLTDGSVVPAGGEFAKVWLVSNSGSTAWPRGTKLVNVGGFSSLVAGKAGVQQFDVPQAEPGEAVEIQCELKAAEEDGHYMDFWRLQAPSGELFGDRFWVDIVVESDDALLRNSGSSLNSSFVAPSMHASGKLQGPSTGTSTEAPSAAASAVSSVAAPSVRSDAIGDGEFEDVRVAQVESSSLGSSEEESEIDDDIEDEDEEFVVLTDSEDGASSSSEDEEWRA